MLDASVAASALVEVTPGERLRSGSRRSSRMRRTSSTPRWAACFAAAQRPVRSTRTMPEAALRAVQSLVTDRYPHGDVRRVAWALRDNLTYYDALYVALAARLGYPLLTADARLARAPGLPCAVELID